MFKRNASIKRFMAYMLVFIMSFSILSPVLAVETKANPESDFEFSDGVITGYTGSATDVEIPEEINGEKVTEIAAKAFMKKGLTSVTFPNTLEKIGQQAFSANQLTSVDFPESVKVIGVGSFLVNSISEVNFKDGLEEIGENAFCKCPIEEVTIPGSVKQIGMRAFSNGKQLKNIDIQEGVEYIGRYAFEKNALTSVTIPDSVINIDDGAFWNNSISEVNLGDGLERIGNQAFVNNKIESVKIPNNLKEIGNNAFLENPNFEEDREFKLYLKEPVNSIEEIKLEVFRDDAEGDIEKVGLNWEKTDKIVDGCQEYLGHFMEFTRFIDANLNAKKMEVIVNVKEEVINEDQQAVDQAIEKVNDLELYEATVENIKSEIKKVVCEDIKVEVEAVEGGEGKYKVTLTKGKATVDKAITVTKIVEDWNSKHFTFEGTAVTGFSELGKAKFATDKELVIPEKTIDGQVVDSIGDKAFNLDSFGEDGIKSLTLPETIKTIGLMAFRNNNIVNLELPDSVEELGNGVFAANRDLETLKLSNSLKAIPKGAFSFSKIEKLVIPEEVTEIGGSAFSDNKLLSDLTISSKVEKIGSRAFWGASITELTIPGNVKEIGSDAFTGGKLSNLTLEEGIETIRRRAFKSNNLSEVTIPKSVTKLDKSAFDKNKGIKIKYASLIEILEKAEKVETEGKTEESIKALQEAIEAGKTMNAKPDATLEEVNTVVKEIQEAIDSLEDKSSKQIIIEDIKKTNIDDKIEITISVSAKEDIKGIMILKPIDENGRTYKVIYEPKEFVSGNNEIKIELKSSDYPKGIKEIKAYIWDSLENMKPLADVEISG